MARQSCKLGGHGAASCAPKRRCVTDRCPFFSLPSVRRKRKTSTARIWRQAHAHGAPSQSAIKATNARSRAVPDREACDRRALHTQRCDVIEVAGADDAARGVGELQEAIRVRCLEQEIRRLVVEDRSVETRVFPVGEQARHPWRHIVCPHAAYTSYACMGARGPSSAQKLCSQGSGRQRQIEPSRPTQAGDYREGASSAPCPRMPARELAAVSMYTVQVSHGAIHRGGNRRPRHKAHRDIAAAQPLCASARRQGCARTELCEDEQEHAKQRSASVKGPMST